MSKEITSDIEFREYMDRFVIEPALKNFDKFYRKNKNKDMVNHPEHYQGLDGLEVDEVMQNFIPKYENSYVGAMIFNVLKYILRAPAKGKQLEDLKKAQKNLKFAIKQLEKLDESKQETKA